MMKKSKSEDKEQRRCTQVQCGYYLQGGCKDCQECKSGPYLINTSCQRCLSCENVPGALRWDDPKKEQQDQVESLGEMDEVKKAVLQGLIYAAAKELDKMEKQPRKEVIINER